MAADLVVSDIGLYAQAGNMAEGSLHPEMLSDSIHDALGHSGCCTWGTGVQKQYANLDMTSPFSGGLVHNIHQLAFRKAMLARDMSVFILVLLSRRVPGFAPIFGDWHSWTSSTQSPTRSCSLN